MVGVTVNGRPVGEVAWKGPFKADLTGLLNGCENRLDIKVIKLWPNRIIGDAQSKVTEGYTRTDFGPFTPASPRDSGLLGPVNLSRLFLRKIPSTAFALLSSEITVEVTCSRVAP